MISRSSSIWSTPGPADAPPPLDFEGFFCFIRFVLKLYEIPRGAGQYFVASCLHHYVVFDSNAPNAGNIPPRFYRNHVSGGKLCFLALGQPGILVNFESQAVPRTVHKILVQTVYREYPPGSRVHFAAGPASLDGVNCRGLRFPNSLIPQAYPCGSLTQIDCSSDVATVVFKYSTQVQHHQLIFPQTFSGRTGMRKRGPRPKRHDAFKRRCRRAALAHLVLDLRGHLKLADAWLQHSNS